MTEELQGLLDRIQKDGVDKAQAEANRILADAREKAAGIVAQAEADAATRRSEADRAAALAEERSRRAIEQAARDVILSIGESLSGALREIVRQETNPILAGDSLAALIHRAIESCAARVGESASLSVILAPEDHEKLGQALLARFGKALKHGLEIRGDASVVRGFRVSVVNENVEHDFAQDAVVDALCQIVRPRLAGIIRAAANPSVPRES